LQKEGSDLLDFGDSDEDDGEDEDEDGDGGARGFVITKDTFDKWVQIAIKLVRRKIIIPNIWNLKRMLICYEIEKSKSIEKSRFCIQSSLPYER
jgi:hypothetical protein